jgi:hypothetical protein
LLSDWTKGFDVSKCISVQSGANPVFLRPWGETGGEGKRYEGNLIIYIDKYVYMCINISMKMNMDMDMDIDVDVNNTNIYADVC